MKQKLKYILVASLAVICMTALKKPAPVSAVAQTFTVNSTNDGGDLANGDGACETSTPGECTLRAAIEQANSNGNPADQDIINFSIAGAGVHTISLATGLGVGEPLIINGYSQPGASDNTTVWPAAMDAVLQIELQFADCAPGACLGVSAKDTTVKGLNINNSPGQAIYIYPSAENFKLQGSYINTDVAGLISEFHVAGGFALQGVANNLTVGGSNPEDRNVLTGQRGMISMFNAKGVTVQGNFLGVGADGVTAMPSGGSFTGGKGIIGLTNAADFTIGGSNEGEGNSIENALSGAVNISGDGSVGVNKIQGNRIIGNADTPLGLNNISNVQVGGTGAYEHNVISGNDN